MPSRERVEQFVRAVVSGEHVRAIADFYHADASMQENLAPPRRGREVLMANEQRALDRIARVDTYAGAVIVDGDNVMVCWTFDMVARDGVVRRLEEVALQRWEGDRLAEEQFFYDTATAWQVVEQPASPA